MKKGFKNYFKSWLVYILIVLLINFILGMFMALIGLQIQDLWLSIISLGIALGTLYGVAHFLDSYDNEEVELPSGAVAFGTN